MKASCLQENLAKALAIAAPAAPSRPSLPILSAALMRTDRSNIKISASDLQTSVSVWIPAQVEEEGAAAPPARLLNELISTLPPDRLDIAATESPTGMNIKCPRTINNISGMIYSDFPALPDASNGASLKIEPKELRAALVHTLFAAAKDDARPALASLKIDVSGDDIAFAAADGFRLAVYKTKLSEPAITDISALVPAQSFERALRPLASHGERPVEILIDDESMTALIKLDSLGGAEIASALTPPRFPEYDTLIPKGNPTKIRLNAYSLRQAARSAAPFAENATNALRFTAQAGANGEGTLRLATEDRDAGYHHSELQALIEGPDAKIAFKYDYIINALEPLGGEAICIELAQPNQAALIRSEEKEAYTYVVMPLQVLWN